MKKLVLLLVTFLLLSCTTTQQKNNPDFVISFGSCNKQYAENILWKEISKNNPDVWIWGGDVIYSDTDNMDKLQSDYHTQWAQKGYKEFANSLPVLGTWDDHDYGLNDGGEEFHVKEESQQLFLDFIAVPKEDIRRKQEGVYHSQIFETAKGSIKIIILDTRYFRTQLTKSTKEGKRYQPNTYGEGTVLGEKQWRWLHKELTNSTTDFNVIVSSIQLISHLHGFESWGNFPHEVDKLTKLIKTSKAKGVIVLSGDRHISEFSSIKTAGLTENLVDFTSSGLTHSYSGFSGEENPNRLGNVVSEISFGILHFNFDTKKVTMQMRGKENKLQQEHIQTYN
ncbi:MAG: alkaline phosphatase D family protein [Polaribacter sp.]|nr:alkaline phosphatase D family protein [Polaribacter sp.]